jgi:hypothetical protein
VVAALKLRGARITGHLSLEGATVACLVQLEHCYFDDTVVLAEARLRSLRMRGCRVPGLQARGLEVAGDLTLIDGFVSHGEVNLKRFAPSGDMVSGCPGGMAV